MVVNLFVLVTLICFFSYTVKNLFLCLQALLHFPKYCEPITSGEAQLTDSRKLWRNIEPHLKRALHTVYLREVSSTQWENILGQETQTGNENLGALGRKWSSLILYFSNHISLI